eukprot:COSAG02_NODE_46649_length_347_cov_0.762097_1_plen_20_part_10
MAGGGFKGFVTRLKEPSSVS